MKKYCTLNASQRLSTSLPCVSHRCRTIGSSQSNSILGGIAASDRFGDIDEGTQEDRSHILAAHVLVLGGMLHDGRVAVHQGARLMDEMLRPFGLVRGGLRLLACLCGRYRLRQLPLELTGRFGSGNHRNAVGLLNCATGRGHDPLGFAAVTVGHFRFGDFDGIAGLNVELAELVEQNLPDLVADVEDALSRTEHVLLAAELAVHDAAFEVVQVDFLRHVGGETNDGHDYATSLSSGLAACPYHSWLRRISASLTF